MTQTFTDNVLIQGANDVVQLTVQAAATQSQPLVQFQGSAGATLAQLNPDGRVLLGNAVAGAADALLQVTYTPTGSQPTSAWHAGGTVTSPGTPVNWVYHQLQLAGTAGTASLHSGLYSKVTNTNTAMGSGADLRGATVQSINLSGSAGAVIAQATGLHADAINGGTAFLGTAVAVAAGLSNSSGGSISQAIAFQVVPPSNSGIIAALYGLQIPDLTAGTASNYAIATGKGLVSLGDNVNIAGSVGIGTTTPSVLLDVVNNISGNNIPPTIEVRTTTTVASDVGANLIAYGQGTNGRASLLLKGSHTGFSGNEVADGATKLLLVGASELGNPKSFAFVNQPGANLLKLDVANDGSGGTMNGVMTWTILGNVGIGTTVPNSVLQLAGPIATALVTKTANYTITAANSIILVNTISSNVTITLPTAVGCPGRRYTIKRINVGANTCTINTTSTQTIDGATTQSLASQWSILRVVSDGSNWLTV